MSKYLDIAGILVPFDSLTLNTAFYQRIYTGSFSDPDSNNQYIDSDNDELLRLSNNVNNRFNSIVRDYGYFTKQVVVNTRFNLFNAFSYEYDEVLGLYDVTSPKQRDPRPRSSERTDNIRRAAQKVFDIACLNRFDWFLTLTFDSCHNRYDYASLLPAIKRFQRRLSDLGAEYLIVPDVHIDGAFHFHALVKKMPEGALLPSGTYCVAGCPRPIRASTIAKKISLGQIRREDVRQEVQNLSDWSEGFSSAIRVYKHGLQLSRYILCHMAAQLQPEIKWKNCTEAQLSGIRAATTQINGRHRYAASSGLVREPEIIYGLVDFDDFRGREYKVGDFVYKYAEEPRGSVAPVFDLRAFSGFTPSFDSVFLSPAEDSASGA